MNDAITGYLSGNIPGATSNHHGEGDRVDHIPRPSCSTEAARRDAQTSLLEELSDATHSSHKVLRELVVRVAGTRENWSDEDVGWIWMDIIAVVWIRP